MTAWHDDADAKDKYIAKLRASLMEILACGELGDGLWDTDAGGPGESWPRQSERLRVAIERAAQLIK